MRLAFLVAFVAAGSIAHAQAVSRQDTLARVDSIFSRFTTTTPGCAVARVAPRTDRAGEGVRDGEPRVRRPADDGIDHRSGIGGEAVHRRGDSAARAAGQALDR